MKTRNIIAIIFSLLTLAVAVFAWPAIDLKILGQEIDWDGLNLSTITGDKYEGELQFGDSMDLREGRRYEFITMLESEDGSDLEEQAESVAQKYAERLQIYGYQDYQIRWSIEDGIYLTLQLDMSAHHDEDMEIVQLLASKGEIQFWTEDPEYDFENADATIYTDALAGMIPISDITADDVITINAVINQKSLGYGLQVVFEPDASVPLLLATSSESSKGTVMTIDGDDVASRYYPIENYEGDNDTPIMYMASGLSSDYELNNAVHAVQQSGPLSQAMDLQTVEVLSPSLGADYLDHLKLGLVLMFGFLSLAVIVRYNWLGIYQMIYLFFTIVWSLATLKLFGAKLSFSLVYGLGIGLVAILLANNTFLSRVQTDIKLKELLIEIRSVRKYYRNFYMFVLFLVLSFAFVNIYHLQQLAASLGTISLVSLGVLYIFTEVFLPQFVVMQHKYESQK